MIVIIIIIYALYDPQLETKFYQENIDIGNSGQLPTNINVTAIFREQYNEVKIVYFAIFSFSS